MKILLFKLRGYIKIYLTLNSVLARSIEKTTTIPQYLQFGHRSDEEKKEEKRRESVVHNTQAGSHSLTHHKPNPNSNLLVSNDSPKNSFARNSRVSFLELGHHFPRWIISCIPSSPRSICVGLALQSPAQSARSPGAPRLADARNDDGSGDDGHGGNLSLDTPALRLDGGEGC